MPTKTSVERSELRRLRAQAKLYDELVDALARAEDELEQLRASRLAPAGIDPVWREIAGELAGALRPYSCFREQTLRGGRIVVETAVPTSTLAQASTALGHLAEQVARESYRAGGMPVDRDRDEKHDRDAGRPGALAQAA